MDCMPVKAGSIRWPLSNHPAPLVREGGSRLRFNLQSDDLAVFVLVADDIDRHRDFLLSRFDFDVGEVNRGIVFIERDFAAGIRPRRNVEVAAGGNFAAQHANPQRNSAGRCYEVRAAGPCLRDADRDSLFLAVFFINPGCVTEDNLVVVGRDGDDVRGAVLDGGEIARQAGFVDGDVDGLIDFDEFVPANSDIEGEVTRGPGGNRNSFRRRVVEGKNARLLDSVCRAAVSNIKDEFITGKSTINGEGDRMCGFPAARLEHPRHFLLESNRAARCRIFIINDGESVHVGT